MENLICFIGFGEAAFHIANGLKSEGDIKIIAYDVNQNDEVRGEIIRQRAKEAGIDLAKDLEGAYESSKYIVSLTSAGVAVKVAKGIIPNLTNNQVYVDMNSASPDVKREIDLIDKNDGVLVCDAAVMTTVPGNGHRVPIFLSGEGAECFYNDLIKFNMNLTNLNAQIGASSAIKMFRSAFMKGLPQLMIESMLPAAEYGALDALIESLNETLVGKTIEDLSQNFIGRTMVHAERRAKEMENVVQTIEKMGFDASMSKSAQKKLEILAEENYVDRVGPKGDIDFKDAINILIKKGER